MEEKISSFLITYRSTMSKIKEHLLYNDVKKKNPKKKNQKKNTNYLFHNAAKFIYINYLSQENILLLN